LSESIRAVTPDDVPAIVRMGLRFAQTEYHAYMPMTAESLNAFVRSLLINPDAHCQIAEAHGVPVGMMASLIYFQPMFGAWIGTEIAWWMEPEARGSRLALKLLRAAERWAMNRGAVRFQMIAPTDHVAAFYERLGFRRLEIHYEKELS